MPIATRKPSAISARSALRSEHGEVQIPPVFNRRRHRRERLILIN
jgi:hypothetical protein